MCSLAFQNVSEQHLAAIAAQLLLAEGIQDVGSWLPIICCLALEAAQSVLPSAMVANGIIDPRFYIKVCFASLRCTLLWPSAPAYYWLRLTTSAPTAS